MGTNGKTCDKPREPALMGRRGFLALLGAGLGLAGLRTIIGGLPAVRRDATAGSGSNGGAADRNTSDVTARYWVRGDELAG